MSTIYVNSGAAGANNGTSWTDAYTSLASTSGASAGDIIKVHKTHSETPGSSITWASGTATNPIQIVCVDKDASDALATGAAFSITTNALTWTGNLYFRGCSITYSVTNFTLAAGTAGQLVFDNCTLAAGTGSANLNITATRALVRLLNCTLDFSGGSTTNCNLALSTVTGTFEMVGGAVVIRSSQTQFSALNGVVGRFRFEGVAFSGGTPTNLFSGGSTLDWSELTFRRCAGLAYSNLFGTPPTAPDATLLIESCASGTITAPALAPTLWSNLRGTIAASLSRYRTGGADDGAQANAYSWEVITTSSANPFTSPLTSPPLTRWVSAGSQTVTVYVASGATLTNEDVWLEVLSPSEAGSATAQAKYQSTKRAALATAANLTTDSGSTWNGTGVGTKQKISVSIAPTVDGPVTVRVRVGKASATVYVDPVIDVDGDVNGKSRFLEGVETFSATSAGGSAGARLVGPSALVTPGGIF